jgi:hypothetical protein
VFTTLASVSNADATSPLADDRRGRLVRRCRVGLVESDACAARTGCNTLGRLASDPGSDCGHATPLAARNAQAASARRATWTMVSVSGTGARPCSLAGAA